MVDGPGRTVATGGPDVLCADEQEDVEIDLPRWQQLASHVLAAEAVRGPAELAITFVDETEISALNEEHMGVSGPTDVLAFPIDDPGLGGDPSTADAAGAGVPMLLGDVVVCPAVAARQAPDHAGTVDDELALLVVHGVLHVLGHDHADTEQAATMRARELQLLETLHWHGPAPGGFRQEHDEPSNETSTWTSAGTSTGTPAGGSMSGSGPGVGRSS